MPEPHVVSVSRDSTHRFSKPVVDRIELVAGHGVAGDVHAGATSRHRYVMRTDPGRANLTQVHLMPAELFPELATRGFTVGPGELGENVTTAGIDLVRLPLGTRLRIGDSVVEITGLRSPCSLINRFQAGLMKACITKDADGTVIRRSGVMGIVLEGGAVAAGSTIVVELPALPHQPLGVV